MRAYASLILTLSLGSCSWEVKVIAADNARHKRGHAADQAHTRMEIDQAQGAGLEQEGPAEADGPQGGEPGEGPHDGPAPEGADVGIADLGDLAATITN